MYHVYKGALGLVPSTHSNGLFCDQDVLRPGSLIRNKVQHTAIVQLLYDCVTTKGLFHATATSYISVFIFGDALKQTWIDIAGLSSVYLGLEIFHQFTIAFKRIYLLQTIYCCGGRGGGGCGRANSFETCSTIVNPADGEF